MKTYRFEFSGTAAAGQTWKTSGTVRTDASGVYRDALKESFEQLTSGRAVYGQPGVGCNGPYQIERILIEQVKD